MKKFTLRLPANLHTQLKQLSVATGMSMSGLVIQAAQVLVTQPQIKETTFIKAFQELSSAKDTDPTRLYTQEEVKNFTDDEGNTSC